MTVSFFAAALLAVSLDASTLDKIARGSQAERQGAVSALAAAGDANAAVVLRALLEGRLYAAPEGPVLIEEGGALKDALTGAPGERPDDLEKVTINNRLRAALDRALAALGLLAADPAARLQASRALQQAADPDLLPAVESALERERDSRVRDALLITRAMLALSAPERSRRLEAVEQLRRAPGASSKRLLAQRLAVEGDPEVKRSLLEAVGSVESALRRADMVGLVFSGLSLGSVLLLAALGLAVTFGLMGVINMAHGELLMAGAYATWLTQSLFRRWAPAHVDWYLLAAVPLSFAAAAALGALLELTVVRKLYGRPLETLLATFGASLVLMQAVRSAFGAQNVEVANPEWMSGGLTVLAGLVLPWNRIAILLFSSLVLLLAWVLLSRTRLGLLVRAVTQNRQRAAGLGVPTPKLDLIAFALGSGIAGLGGCALSQISNVGPELGQGFIVDSFMVVVLGGVGQLAGTVGAAAGLGLANKVLEPVAGAVLAKILVLVFIILFIQRRPQGLFALRGRAADE
jgi:urea transport system permease protein